MPELSDDLYCSQQIMVPPMFPYILRQYAKAAIRSQPTDLLRWSTAYFRCLSLNLQPPVKPRLEYPLPKDYDGITPGWLKALLYQLINNTHVDFKVLWDCWIGACQNHLTLIKILCLGGFTDPIAVPLYRFIGLCVGFLNENLTQTMIMFCEVVTEEPEGGSAMISVETFIDVYTFLAGIDSSKDQILLNRVFTDDTLALLEKKKEKKEAVQKKEMRADLKETSIEAETIEEEEKVEEDRKDVISCPDLTEDVDSDGSSVEIPDDAQSKSTMVDDKERFGIATGKTESEIDLEQGQEIKKHVRHSDIIEEVAGITGDTTEHVDESEAEGDKGEEEETTIPHPEDTQEDKIQDEITEAIEPIDAGEAGEEKEVSEAVTAQASLQGDKLAESISDAEEQKEEDETIQVDIEKYLEAESLMGESNIIPTELVEVVKERLEMVQEYSIAEGEEEGEEVLEAMEEKFQVEEIFVERIPGIGCVVPQELIEAVVAYMKKCAESQQGMVMPRNIRHYSCPPLEVHEQSVRIEKL